MFGCSCPGVTAGVITDVPFRNSTPVFELQKSTCSYLVVVLIVAAEPLKLNISGDCAIFEAETNTLWQIYIYKKRATMWWIIIIWIIIVPQLYLSLKVEGQAGHTVRMHILEDGHCLHSVGVPNADIRLLAHLSCGHQHTLRMQS